MGKNAYVDSKQSAKNTAILYVRSLLKLAIDQIETRIVAGKIGAINALPLFCEDESAMNDKNIKVDRSDIGELKLAKMLRLISLFTNNFEFTKHFDSKISDASNPTTITIKCGA